MYSQGKENEEVPNSIRSSLLVFSPIKGSALPVSFPTNNESQSYSTGGSKLVCAKFQDQLKINFGEAPLGATRVYAFQIENPSSAKSVVLSVQRISAKVGLTIQLGEALKLAGGQEIGQSLEIPPKSSSIATIYWTPMMDFTMREIITLRMDDKASLQVVVSGTAGTGKDESHTGHTTHGKKACSLSQHQRRASEANSAKLHSITGVAPSRRQSLQPHLPTAGKLCNRQSLRPTVVQPSLAGQSLVPRKPNSSHANREKKRPTSMAFCASDDSEDWANKQIQIFTEWINTVFSECKVIDGGDSSADRALVAGDKEGSGNAAKKRMPVGSGPSRRDDAITESWESTHFKSTESCSSISSDDTSSLPSHGFALHTLLLKRQEARTRQAAAQLLRDEGVAEVVKSIENEVNEGRLTMREDRDVFADLGLQESLMDMLCSYEPLWFCLGVEAVFNTFFHPQSFKAPATKSAAHTNNAIIVSQTDHKSTYWRREVRAFLLSHLLTDEKIMSQFAKPQQLLYKAQEKKMKEMLRKHFLKKFLVLVFFLDNARVAKVVPKATLFARGAKFKSSSDVVCEFCREFLRGEGDVLRHLSLVNCSFKFQQSYIDEFDYRVTNLASDLRDGIRLCRLLETLQTQSSSSSSSVSNPLSSTALSAQLRVPAISRLQKLHNLRIVLQRAYEGEGSRRSRGGEGQAPDPKFLADGNRDVTLMVLWQIFYSCNLRMLVSPEDVLREATAVREDCAWRCDPTKRGAGAITGQQQEGEQLLAVRFRSAPLDANDADESVSERSGRDRAVGQTDNEKLYTALLKWTQAVAAQYDIPVYDLTSCLADGRALCLLVHYYHPSILPLRSIQQTTNNFLDSFLTKTSLDPFIERRTSLTGVTPAMMQRGLQGEQRNFSVLKQACKQIGGIPVMMLPAAGIDTEHVPQERTMTMFLGYMFGRLVESAAQVRASVRIQRTARSCFLPKLRALQRQREAAALKLTEERGVEEQREQAADPAALDGTLLPTAGDTRREEDDSSKGIVDVGVQIVLSRNQAARVLQLRYRAHRLRAAFLRQTAEKEVAKSLEAKKREAFSQTVSHSPPHVTVTAADTTSESGSSSPAGEVQEQLLQLKEEEKEEAEDCVQSCPATLKTDLAASTSCAGSPSMGERTVERAETCSRTLSSPAQELAELALRHRMQAELAAQLEHEKKLLLSAEKKRLAERIAEETAKARAAAQEELMAVLTAKKQAEEEAICVELQEQAREIQLLREKTQEMETLRAKTHEMEQYEKMAEDLRKALKCAEGRLSELESSRQRAQGESERADETRRQLTEMLALEQAQHQQEVQCVAQRLQQEEQRFQQEHRERLEAEQQAQIERARLAEAEEQARVEREARLQLEAQLRAMQDEQRQQEEQASKQLEAARMLRETQQRLVVRIQSRYRAILARKTAHTRIIAIVCLQTVTRGFIARRNAKCALLAVLILQSCWRRRRCQSFLARLVLKATNVQAWWRMHNHKRCFLVARRGVSLLSAEWRAHATRRSFQRMRRAAVLLQKHSRASTARKHFLRALCAVVLLQAVVRARILAVNCVRKRRHSLVIVQRAWRAAVAVRQLRHAMRERSMLRALRTNRKLRAASTVNRFFRTTVKEGLQHKSAVRILSRWLLSRLPLVRARKLCAGFRRLAALWRSLRVRRRSSKRVTELRRRIVLAEQRARADPSLRLGRQTQAALYVLSLHGSNGSNGSDERDHPKLMISQLLKACQTLELSTKVSKRCCEAFAQAKASNVLFALLRSCNRSTPHQELLRIALVVLLHVARHAHLSALVAEQGTVRNSAVESGNHSNDNNGSSNGNGIAVDALVDLMQMFRDKKSIFNLACELLTRLVHACAATKDKCNAAQYRKRLEGLLNIIERRNKMDSRLKNLAKPAAATVSTNHTSSSSSTTTIAATATALTKAGIGAAEFEQYKGRAYDRLETIACISHLVRLLNQQ